MHWQQGRFQVPWPFLIRYLRDPLLLARLAGVHRLDGSCTLYRTPGTSVMKWRCTSQNPGTIANDLIDHRSPQMPLVQGQQHPSLRYAVEGGESTSNDLGQWAANMILTKSQCTHRKWRAPVTADGHKVCILSFPPSALNHAPVCVPQSARQVPRPMTCEGQSVVSGWIQHTSVTDPYHMSYEVGTVRSVRCSVEFLIPACELAPVFT